MFIYSGPPPFGTPFATPWGLLLLGQANSTARLGVLSLPSSPVVLHALMEYLFFFIALLVAPWASVGGLVLYLWEPCGGIRLNAGLEGARRCNLGI